jgi:hypothetical protein
MNEEKDFLLADFATPSAVVDAARRAAEAGVPALDALCPTPVEGLFDLLASPRSHKPIGWIMFVAGVLGALAGYFMQWYSAVIDYPIDSGGRPLNSWPAFLLVPYETTILSAGVVGVLAWLWLCGLPKLFHPLFAVQAVERASQDRYLLIFAADHKTHAWLKKHMAAALARAEP